MTVSATAPAQARAEESGAAPESPLLRLDEVGLVYGRTRALEKVSLALYPGSIVALMGPNGAGKSSLVHVLTGALTPDEGRCLRGPALDTRPIALVPQEIALYSWLTARENCIAFARIGGAPATEAKRRADAALALTCCQDVAGTPVARLSGGYQRRVNIAAALVNDPALVILDEPTVGIDLDARRAIAGLLSTLRSNGTGVLIVTHDFPEADQIADRAVFLKDGRIVADGAPAALLEARFGRMTAVEIVFASEPDAASAMRLRAHGAEPTASGTVWTCLREIANWDASVFAEVLSREGLALAELRLRRPGLEWLYQALMRESTAP